MGDYGQFKVGNVIYPTTYSLTDSPLKRLNPPIYYGLEYISSMIQLKLGDDWDQVVAGLGLTDLVGKIVAYKLPYDPHPDYMEQQVKFPLLALWEQEGQMKPHTFSWYKNVSTWQMLYALPPLTSGQKEVLHPFLKAVRDVVHDRTEQGYDPDYNDSEEVWSDGYAGISKLQPMKYMFAKLPFPDQKRNMFFPALLITFEVEVREEFNRDFLEEMTGTNIVQLLDDEPFLEMKIDI